MNDPTSMELQLYLFGYELNNSSTELQQNFQTLVRPSCFTTWALTVQTDPCNQVQARTQGGGGGGFEGLGRTSLSEQK